MSIRQGKNIISGRVLQGGLEVGDIGISLFVDETKGLRRYLNGSIVAINDNTRAFLDRIKQIATLYPSITCSESEWQAISALSVGGQCGKFVIDEMAGTIRLPKIVMPIQGLTDLSKLGELVEAGLPNITGSFGFTDEDGSGAMVDYAFAPNGSLISGCFSKGSVTKKGLDASGRGTVNGADVVLNASNSSSIYKDDSTVQQEQIQYPYFIQIATGQETQVDIVNEIELNNPFSLLDSKYSDHTLSNASWLLSNGQWNSGTVYVDVYNLLVKLLNGTETIEGISVKAVGDSTITDYDFVVDTANTQFKLPIKSILASGKAVVGNEKAIGITNGAGNYGLGFFSNATYAGLAGWVDNYGKDISTTGGVSGTRIPSGSIVGLTTDSANSGIETDTTGLYLYYYVGETVQNANLVDVGRIAEQLATKEDIDTWVYWQQGTEGYRYNRRNGYCEQWGEATAQPVVFIKKYASKPNVVCSLLYNGTGYRTVATLTPLQVTFYTAPSTQAPILWKATGYLAEGEF